MVLLRSVWPGAEATPHQVQALTALGLFESVPDSQPLHAAAATIATMSSNTALRSALIEGLALFNSLLHDAGVARLGRSLGMMHGAGMKCV